jgi:hypothetical protein
VVRFPFFASWAKSDTAFFLSVPSNRIVPHRVRCFVLADDKQAAVLDVIYCRNRRKKKMSEQSALLRVICGSPVSL